MSTILEQNCFSSGNDVSLISSFDNISCHLQQTNKIKRTNEIHHLIWIVDDIDQFDRCKERKESFLKLMNGIFIRISRPVTYSKLKN